MPGRRRDRLRAGLRRAREALGRAARPWIEPRSFHAYCVGAPKTGTHSVAGLCGGYRAEHEPGAEELIALVLRDGGPPSRRAISRWLRQRDRRLWLDMESSHVLAFFAGELAGAFPRAAFVLTVRHPTDWLRSLVEHLHRQPAGGVWGQFRDLRFGPRSGHPLEEAPLARGGLHTVDGYLRYWCWHNETVLRAVPAQQLLILHTRELSGGEGQERLAAHLGVPARTLVASRSHSYQTPPQEGPALIDTLDPAYLAARVAALCAPLVARLGLT